MNMKSFGRLFQAKPTVPTVAAAQPQTAVSDALPGEVDAAIGAAHITIRAFGPHTSTDDDCRTIVEIPGLRSIKFEPVEFARLVSVAWPHLSPGQVKRAVDYMNNRCVAEARRIGQATVVREKPLKWWEKKQPSFWDQGQ